MRNIDLSSLHATALDARRSFVDVVTDDVMIHTGGVHINRSVAPGGPPVLYNAQPTRRAHHQIAGRAGVPTKFYDRLLEHHPGLYDHTMRELYPAGPSLLRARVVDDAPPVLRAVLSDRYRVIDNVDIITTMLSAFVECGLSNNEVSITGDFDADDGHLRMRVVVPSIGINARELVKNYRSPFDSRSGADLPMLFAGLEVANSETGGGALTIRPRAVLQVCNNGLTRDVRADVFRQVHLGARLEQGVVAWSDETRTRHLALIASAAADAIRTFISPEYLTDVLAAAETAAGLEITTPIQAMATVAQLAQLSDEEADDVMGMFMRSGDTSVLGLANAVTAAAQADHYTSDRQAELEVAFWSIVDHAERVAAAA